MISIQPDNLDTYVYNVVRSYEAGRTHGQGPFVRVGKTECIEGCMPSMPLCPTFDTTLLCGTKLVEPLGSWTRRGLWASVAAVCYSRVLHCWQQEQHCACNVSWRCGEQVTILLFQQLQSLVPAKVDKHDALND